MKTHNITVNCYENGELVIEEKARVASEINDSINYYSNRIKKYQPVVDALIEIQEKLYGGTIYSLLVN